MRVEKLVFSPHSDLLAVCMSDRSLNAGYLQVWNVHSDKPKGPSFWHGDGVLTAAWFSDGKKLATASEDGRARIWDLDSMQQYGAEVNHRKEVVDIDLKDNALLLTASWDKFIHIADAQSGLGAGPPVRFPDTLVSARWLPNATTVLARQIDGQYWTLHLPPAAFDLAIAKHIAITLAGRVQPKSGLAPYEAALLLEAEWRSLRAAFPAVFTTSVAEVVAWCRVEGQRCRQSGLIQPELELLKQLLRCQPKDPIALARKRRIEEELRLKTQPSASNIHD
jgi:hypothetical protein